MTGIVSGTDNYRARGIGLAGFEREEVGAVHCKELPFAIDGGALDASAHGVDDRELVRHRIGGDGGVGDSPMCGGGRQENER